MTYIIECEDISKSFGKTNALVDINIKIQENKIYGLLGRNGAGKSTLLNIIDAQMFPTTGEVRVFGETPFENKKVLENICLVKESGMFLKDLKVKDAIYLASLFYPNWDTGFAERLLDEFELDKNKLYKNLSLGMKSQLSIIVGLSGRSPLTIFDEPYIGLDAPGRQFFYDILMEDYMNNPRTIILSTHLIDEISNMLEEIIILHKGKVKIEGNADEIRNKAFYISGDKMQVENFIKFKKVLHEECMGENMLAVIYDSLYEKEKAEIYSSDLNISSIPMQQLFIYLTGGKMVKRGVINE
ncbi:MAG: ABC transporter ATP-binding protein [Firmicutes bacterium]|nr:ABC transporter ATP-binding protein [Bacillota bacterium]